MAVQYTPAQLKAVTENGSNIIVSAGAGSGKTQVLSGRVTEFVKNKNYNYKLENFLILTFTNLAAANMKERIRSALQKEGLSEAENVDIADIATFDAYALKIVKKYHNKLNVSPELTNIDSNIIAVKERVIIQSIFEEYYLSNNQYFEKMVSKLCFKDDDEIREFILKIYKKAKNQLDTDHYLNCFISEFYNEENLKEKISEASLILFKYLEQVQKEVEEDIKRNASNKTFMFEINIFNKLISDLCSQTTYDGLMEAYGRFKQTEIYKNFPAIKNFKTLVRYLDKIVILREKNLTKEEEKRETFDKLVSLMPNSEKVFLEFFESIKPYAELLFEITRKLHTQIQEYKNDKQAFEFQDIAKMALKIVKEDEDVRNEIKDNLKMIMVDEYQDTSDIQDQFVFLIANNNVYMVGDVKQSIYRFRNAKVDIFIKKYDDYKNDNLGTAIDLNKNFRSRKEVLDDINFIFKKIMSKKFGGADYYKEHVIEWGNSNYEKGGKVNQNMHSEFIVHNELSAAAVPEVESNLVVRDIINKINSGFKVMDSRKIKVIKDGEEIEEDEYFSRPCKFSDFCILADRSTYFDAYAKTFSENKIPLYLEYDENIKETMIVLVMRSVFKLIKCLLNYDYSSIDFKQSYLSLARSFVFEIPDSDIYQACKILNNKQSKFEQIKEIPVIKDFYDIVNKCRDYPLVLLIVKVLEEIKIREKIILLGDVDRNQQFLDIFMELFSQMGRLGYSIDEFILFLDTIDKTEELKIVFSSGANAIDSVTMMNIHKSKGLEFKIIYFVGLKKMFNRNDLAGKLKISDEYGLVMPPFDDKGPTSNSDENNQEEANEESENKTILDVLYQNYEVEQDLSEKVRLFYVALTRTQEKMIFVAEDEKEYFCLQLKENYQNYLLYVDPNGEFASYEFEDYYSLFKDGIINYTLFKLLSKRVNVSIPRKYDLLTLDKKREMSLDDLLSLIAEENELHTKLNEFIEIIDNSEDLDKRGLIILDYLLTDKVTYEEFEYLCYYYKYHATERFKANYESQTLFKGKKLKMNKTWFELANGEELNPLNYLKYPYADILLEVAILTSQGYIPHENFIELLNVLNIDLQNEYDEFLKEVESIRKDIDSLDEETATAKYDELISLINSKNENISSDIFTYNGYEKTIFLEKEDRINFQNLLADLLNKNLISPLAPFVIEELVLGIPLLKGFNNIVYDLSLGKNDYDVSSIIKGMNIYGIVTTDLLERQLNLLKEKKISYSNFLSIPKYKLVGPSKDIIVNSLTNEKMPYEVHLKNIFKMFLEETIDLDELKLYASFANYDLDIDFKLLEKDKQLSLSENEYYKAFVYDMKQVEIDQDILNFAGFIDEFIDESSFNKYHYDRELRVEPLIKFNSLNKKGEIKLKFVSVDNTITNKFHPSKNLQLSVSKDTLDLGTHLHECLEVFDFKNPDFTYIKDEKVKKLIQKFLDSSLAANIKDADIYPEYPYFDEENNQNGIIDLMLIYPDYIQIIDYKTKNIADEHYDEQLKTYGNYIKKTFNKKVKLALYSIMTGDIREIDYE